MDSAHSPFAWLWVRVRLELFTYWFVLHTLIKRVRLGCGKGLIAGTVAVALIAAPVVMLSHQLGPVFARKPVLHLVLSLPDRQQPVCCSALEGRNLRADIPPLLFKLKLRKESLASLNKEHKRLKVQLASLDRVHAAWHRCERTRERHAKLVDLLNSRRYRLIHRDWRSRAGSPLRISSQKCLRSLVFP